MGPPGSGKGTIARIIREKHGIPSINTGDLLREEVSKSTEIGMRSKPFMDKGQLVPDVIVNPLVEQRLRKSDCRHGFVLDGYPRNIQQAKSLDDIFSRLEIHFDLVLDIVVGEEELVRRLTTRRICPSCGAIYNTVNKPPSKPGVCDICGTTIIQRDDDKEEVIRNRLKVYRDETDSVIEWYDARGLIRKVRGDIGLDSLPGEVGRVLSELVSG